MLTPRLTPGARGRLAVLAVAAASAGVVAVVVHASGATSNVSPADHSTDRRLTYDTAIPAITSLLTPLGTFGGLWLDNSQGWYSPVLHVVSTEPLPATVTAQVSALLAGEPVVYQHSPVTEAYLDGVQDEIETSGLLNSLHIEQTSTDVVTSPVDILIPTTSAPSIEHLLRARLGPHLRITRADEVFTAVAGDAAAG